MIKKLIATCCLLTVYIPLFANNKECGCGSVYSDLKYAKAVVQLENAIKETVWPWERFPASAISFLSSEWDNYPYWKLTWTKKTGAQWYKGQLDEQWGEPFDTRDYSIQVVYTQFIRRVKSETATQEELIEEQIFDVNNNYSTLVQVFKVLRNDITLLHEKEKEFLDARIKDKKNGDFVVLNEPSFFYPSLTFKEIKDRKQKAYFEFLKRDKIITENESKAISLCSESFDRCIEQHKNPIAHLDRGLFHYLEGNTLEALDLIDSGLERLKGEDFASFKEKALLIKGQSELEAGLYANAILTLTELIKNNSQSKEACFERAVAYFENGEFDKSIANFLQSEMTSGDKEKASSSPQFAAGLMEGIKKGFQEEFGDSLPVWAPIMGYGAWTALSNLPFLPTKLVTATLSCIAAAGVYLAADQMVAELRELVTNWDHLTPHERGQLSGFLIGKHGVDIFLFAGSAKLMETYRDLKKANDLLTFELAVANEANLASLKARWGKIEKFKKDQAYIQTSFGKSSYPEYEIRDNLQKMGYSIPKRAEGIPQNCITRYSDKNCGMGYHDPAKPNYNCDRFMPGNPQSPNPKQQKPYIIQKRNGHCLDKDGNKVEANDPRAHILRPVRLCEFELSETKLNCSEASRTSETIAEKQDERGGAIWQSRSQLKFTQSDRAQYISSDEYVFRPWNYKPPM